jgi:hypothetical protein
MFRKEDYIRYWFARDNERIIFEENSDNVLQYNRENKLEISCFPKTGPSDWNSFLCLKHHMVFSREDSHC